MELSETGLADHIWGYCPKDSWQATDLEPSASVPGELRVVSDFALVPGVAIKASKARLPVFYNEHKNWLCIGDPSANQGFGLRLAPDFIIIGDVSQITSLWVRIDRFED